MSERNVYERADGRWTWVLRSESGVIIAVDGGQGYDTEDGARRMADAVVGGNYARARKTTTTK